MKKTGVDMAFMVDNRNQRVDIIGHWREHVNVSLYIYKVCHEYRPKIIGVKFGLKKQIFVHRFV